MSQEAIASPAELAGRVGWRTGLFITVLTVVIVALAAEAMSRLLFKEHVVLFPRYHTHAQYGDFTIRRLVPDTTFQHRSIDGRWQFTTNAQGFRDDRNYHYAKPPGTYRVLNLGDSHTQGFEVRQAHTFSKVLERALQNVGITTEVMNTGISGFGTAEQLVYLEQEGLRHDPDAVVLAFYANDFEDNVKAGLYGLEEGALVLRKQRHTPGVRTLNLINAFPPLRWLSEHSYLYSIALNTVWVTAKKALARRSSEGVAIEYALPMEEVNDYRRDLTLALLARIHELSRERGIPFILVDVPRPSGSQIFRSSVPEELESAFRERSDTYIPSEVLLGHLRGVREVHLPNGHRHISEVSHLLIGLALGEHLGQDAEVRVGAAVP